MSTPCGEGVEPRSPNLSIPRSRRRPRSPSCNLAVRFREVLLRLQGEPRGHDAPWYVLMDDQRGRLAGAGDEEPAACGRGDRQGGGAGELAGLVRAEALAAVVLDVGAADVAGGAADRELVVGEGLQRRVA